MRRSIIIVRSHLISWCFFSSNLRSCSSICSRCWETSCFKFSSRTLLCCSLNVLSWNTQPRYFWTILSQNYQKSMKPLNSFFHQKQVTVPNLSALSHSLRWTHKYIRAVEW